MEYMIFLGIVAVFMLIAAVTGIRREREAKKKFLARAKANYGKAPEKKYTQESFLHITRYYEKHPSGTAIDDITWNDLGMDAVYRRVNYCHSSAGEEVLYYVLRNPRTKDDARTAVYESHAQWFDAHEEGRLAAQMQFSRMHQGAKYSIYDYLDQLELLGNRSNTRHFLMLAAILLALAGCFVAFDIAFLALLALLIVNLLTYFREKGEVEPFLSSFTYVLRVQDSAEDLIGVLDETEFAEEIQSLRTYLEALSMFRLGASIAMSPPRMTGGSPLDMLLDYVRILTHADLIKFNQMLQVLREKTDEIDGMLTVIGTIDVALSIACYRASLNGAYCLPEFTDTDDAFILEEGRHPLLPQAVPNTIHARKGVLITGSNASGKSTFLKTCAIAALFAQTLHTVPAKRYEAAACRLFSSMSLRDDLSGGDSYYIVEIKSLKRILDAIDEAGDPVLCFVDEVLRGTNTVERIAASTKILSYFAERKVRCFAATHDVELAELLADGYDNYHFEGELTENDVRFTYRLQEGKAKTRNAIRLLQLMGYEENIVRSAEEMAERFLAEGKWSAEG